MHIELEGKLERFLKFANIAQKTQKAPSVAVRLSKTFKEIPDLHPKSPKFCPLSIHKQELSSNR